MITFCAVKGCSNKLRHTKGNLEISYHKFPYNSEYLDQWIRFCGWDDGWKPRPNQGICSKHFDRSCFGGQHKMRRKLKSGVMPNKESGTGNKDITQDGHCKIKEKHEEIDRPDQSDAYIQIEAGCEKIHHSNTNSCKICHSDLQPDAKHLFEPAVASISYMGVIQEVLSIQVFCDDDKNMRICNKCSGFLEDLYSFSKLCRDSLTDVMNFQHNSLNTVKQEQFETEEETVLELMIEPMVTDAFQNEDTAPVKNEDPKQCDICGVFIKQDLQMHKKTHFNVSVKCDVCGKTYTNARQLQVHMNVHTKNIPYPCKFCDKVFYVWRSQKDHEQTHMDRLNNVEHRCNECDNVYATKKQLEVHFKLKHLGIRKHVCQHCSFKTNQKDRLLHHVRAKHTDKRPYGCPVCDNTTSNDSNHYSHFQRHKKKGEADEYKIRCAYCAKVFTKDAVFEMHLMDEHPEEAVIV